MSPQSNVDSQATTRPRAEGGGSELTFRLALATLWQQRLLIILGMILATAAAAADLYLHSPRYASFATVQLVTQNSLSNPSTSAPNLQLVTSDAVTAAAAKTLGRSGTAGLAGAVHSSYQASVNVVTITGTTSTPLEAQRVSHAFAGAYIDALRALDASQIQSLQSQQDKLTAKIKTIKAQMVQSPSDELLKTQLVSAQAAYTTIGTELLQAEIAPAPASLLHDASAAVSTAQPRSRVLALGALIGLLAGCGLALLRDRFDPRLRTVDDVERLVRRPVLAQLPYLRSYRHGRAELTVVNEPRSRFAQSIRELRTSTTLLFDSRETAVLIVTSPTPVDGKTLVSVNLAASFALSGRRTILVSGDMRRPRVEKFFEGPDTDRGLADVLTEASDAPEVTSLLRKTAVDGLLVLPAGCSREDAADCLASKAMGRVMRQLQDAADVVIIDSPPVMAFADAAITAAHADGTILVVRARKAKERDVLHALKRLGAANVAILGVVLNRVRSVVGSDYGGYYPLSQRSESD
jgi:capsular exopolysaccharide synthesis family protein